MRMRPTSSGEHARANIGSVHPDEYPWILSDEAADLGDGVEGRVDQAFRVPVHRRVRDRLGTALQGHDASR